MLKDPTQYKAELNNSTRNPERDSLAITESGRTVDGRNIHRASKDIKGIYLVAQKLANQLASWLSLKNTTPKQGFSGIGRAKFFSCMSSIPVADQGAHWVLTAWMKTNSRCLWRVPLLVVLHRERGEILHFGWGPQKRKHTDIDSSAGHTHMVLNLHREPPQTSLVDRSLHPTDVQRRKSPLTPSTIDDFGTVPSVPPRRKSAPAVCRESPELLKARGPGSSRAHAPTRLGKKIRRLPPVTFESLESLAQKAGMNMGVIPEPCKE